MTKSNTDYYVPLIDSIMNQERAEQVRRLRVEKDNTWRGVAEECHKLWGEDAAWSPPSNQIPGMFLCERATRFFGENYLEESW